MREDLDHLAMTQEEVARRLGITRSGVFMLERYVIRKLWRSKKLRQRFIEGEEASE